MARLLTAIAVLFLMIHPHQLSAEDYEPGFSVYDPNRKCHQAWCYMGKPSEEVGSIQQPFHPEDYTGVGLGMFVKGFRIDFMEMPFHDTGNYSVKLIVLTNKGDGKFRKDIVYKGRAALKESVLFIPSEPAIARSFMRGRFVSVYIYRNGKPYVATLFPLYGFTKAYSHIR